MRYINVCSLYNVHIVYNVHVLVIFIMNKKKTFLTLKYRRAFVRIVDRCDTFYVGLSYKLIIFD